MSASLLVMVPFMLLAIVSALCFVGCAFTTTGSGNQGPPLFNYSDDTVLANEATLLAYWRLNEGAGSGPGSTAVNSRSPGTADGTYVSQPFPDDPAQNSVAAPGTLSFAQSGLLAGDLQPPFTAGSPRQPSVFVDGAFVKVGWDPTIAPSEADGFTIEAWVHTSWAEKEPKADRAVMVQLELTGPNAFNGFGIVAAMDQTWKAFVGTGSGITFAPGGTLAFDTDAHLVATYAMGQLKLYVNGVQSSPTTSAVYSPTTAAQLYIGAGGPHLPAPRVPFVGHMQCVALYRGAFSDADVLNHFNKGKGA